MSRLSFETSDQQLAPLLAEETAKSSQHKLFHLVSLTHSADAAFEPLHLVDSNYSVTFKGTEYGRFPLKYSPAGITSDGTIDKTHITISNVSREMMRLVETYDGLRGFRVYIKLVYANALDFVYTPNLDGTVTTSANPEANVTAYTEEEYFIDSYTANEQIVTFALEPIIDVEVRIPRRRYMVDSCYWKYKDLCTCRFDATKPVGYISAAAGSNTFQAVIVDTHYWVPNVGIRFRVEGSTTEYTVEGLQQAGVSGCTGYIVGTFASAVSGNVYLTDSPYNNCNKTLADCVARNNSVNYGGFPGVSGSRRIVL